MPEPGAGAKPSAGRAAIPPAPSVQNESGVVLGFDYGTRRIGVAIGNTVSAGARPLCVIAAGQSGTWDAIAALIDQWHPSVLIVGIAVDADGAPHEMTARCERFARQLEGRFGRPVARVDERYSSAVVGGAMARDDDAAAVIVQQWLDQGGHR